MGEFQVRQFSNAVTLIYGQCHHAIKFIVLTAGLFLFQILCEQYVDFVITAVAGNQGQPGVSVQGFLDANGAGPFRIHQAIDRQLRIIQPHIGAGLAGGTRCLK